MNHTGEFALIEAINEVLDAHQSAKPRFVNVTIDAGDDAAALQAERQARVDSDAPTWLWSIDTFTDGVHFRRVWSSAKDIGRRAIAASASDVIAMGGTPAVCLVAFSAPAKTPIEWVRDLAAGMAIQSDEFGARLIGGDVSESQTLSLCVSFIGVMAPGLEPVTRAGARAGQVVAVCGDLGKAAAGLALLQSGNPEDGFEQLVKAHRYPTIDSTAGERAARAGATSLIDISDGLIADLGHVARDSGVQINIKTDLIEISPSLETLAAYLEQDPMTWVLSGGDGHALVATFSKVDDLPEGFFAIGEVNQWQAENRDTKDVLAPNAYVTVDDEPYQQPAGYQHFI